MILSSSKTSPKIHRRKKVLILADSQGRQCNKNLSKELNEHFEVQSVIKPGAKFCDVIKNVDNMCKDFNQDDCVIILAGTNDVDTIQDNGTYAIENGVKDLVKISKHTNLILNPVPYRYDDISLNHTISDINVSMHKVVNYCEDENSKNIQINFDLERLTRQNYTHHGLHLSRYGKINLAKQWARRIYTMNFLQPTISQLNR